MNTLILMPTLYIEHSHKWPYSKFPLKTKIKPARKETKQYPGYVSYTGTLAFILTKQQTK